MTSITVVKVDRSLAMRIVSPESPNPDLELIKATAHVTDDDNIPQPDVTVYWSSQGVNEGLIKYYDIDTLQPLAGLQSKTGADGTTNVYVGSTNNLIATIQASLVPMPSEIEDRPNEKILVKTNNIAVCTFLPDGGDQPEPTLVEKDDGYVEPDSDTDPTYWPSSVQDTVPVFPDYTGRGARFIPWLWTSDDMNARGDELGGIQEYGQQLSFKVQYYKMATGANASNKLAYMLYVNNNPHISNIWPFQASGSGVVWPDPDRPINPELAAVQYVLSPQGTPQKIPNFIDYTYFDTPTGTLNFAIPVYADVASTDDIAINAYLNAWYQGEPNNKIFPVYKNPKTKQNYKGADFAGGWLRFFLTRKQLVDFCMFESTQKYGCMIIQYVVNNMHYSPFKDPPAKINFCDQSRSDG